MIASGLFSLGRSRRSEAAQEAWSRQPAATRPVEAPTYEFDDYARAYDARAGDVGRALASGPPASSMVW